MLWTGYSSERHRKLFLSYSSINRSNVFIIAEPCSKAHFPCWYFLKTLTAFPNLTFYFYCCDKWFILFFSKQIFYWKAIWSYNSIVHVGSIYFYTITWTMQTSTVLGDTSRCSLSASKEVTWLKRDWIFLSQPCMLFQNSFRSEFNVSRPSYEIDHPPSLWLTLHGMKLWQATPLQLARGKTSTSLTISRRTEGLLGISWAKMGPCL